MSTFSSKEDIISWAKTVGKTLDRDYADMLVVEYIELTGDVETANIVDEILEEETA